MIVPYGIIIPHACTIHLNELYHLIPSQLMKINKIQLSKIGKNLNLEGWLKRKGVAV